MEVEEEERKRLGYRVFEAAKSKGPTLDPLLPSLLRGSSATLVAVAVFQRDRSGRGEHCYSLRGKKLLAYPTSSLEPLESIFAPWPLHGTLGPSPWRVGGWSLNLL